MPILIVINKHKQFYEHYLLKKRLFLETRDRHFFCHDRFLLKKCPKLFKFNSIHLKILNIKKIILLNRDQTKFKIPFKKYKKISIYKFKRNQINRNKDFAIQTRSQKLPKNEYNKFPNEKKIEHIKDAENNQIEIDQNSFNVENIFEKKFSIINRDSFCEYRKSSIDSEIENPKDIPNFNFEIDRDLEEIDSNNQIEKINIENFQGFNNDVDLNQGNFLSNPSISKISQHTIEDLEEPILDLSLRNSKNSSYFSRNSLNSNINLIEEKTSRLSSKQYLDFKSFKSLDQQNENEILEPNNLSLFNSNLDSNFILNEP
ncbi:unnamed protein product [Brachionus calyciflorus]|uniref:Uncharacterized protein n=1 Tax=Brachionus calyciflorus TaxID=104777 RepID=A0A814GB73_9BILA|nr:unnamed protein product [Brachionus calyciflorus]